MIGKPTPVVFAPIFKPKPWGGRKLASLLGKALPTDASLANAPPAVSDAASAPPADIAIGESWELVSLPGHGSHPGDESRVRDGPLKGVALHDLVAAWGRDLLGDAPLIDGRFPLLIKFLDARENLSVQVHPKPTPQPAHAPAAPPSASLASGLRAHAAVKHEAWYVLAADPGAELLIGLREGVTREQFARVADTPQVAEYIRRWPAKPGHCYYLPSGTVHALGAGVVVAEIQTPSDITYRLYDWGRTDRQLHIRDALENTRYDVQPAEILQPRRHVASVHSTATRLTVTERFIIEKIRLREGVTEPLTPGDMAVWIILSGRGVLRCPGAVPRHPGGVPQAACEIALAAGDVALIPAACRDAQFESQAGVEWLDVRVPIASRFAGMEHPAPEPPPQRDGLVQLTHGGHQTQH